MVLDGNVNSDSPENPTRTIHIMNDMPTDGELPEADSTPMGFFILGQFFRVSIMVLQRSLICRKKVK